MQSEEPEGAHLANQLVFEPVSTNDIGALHANYLRSIDVVLGLSSTSAKRTRFLKRHETNSHQCTHLREMYPIIRENCQAESNSPGPQEPRQRTSPAAPKEYKLSICNCLSTSIGFGRPPAIKSERVEPHVLLVRSGRAQSRNSAKFPIDIAEKCDCCLSLHTGCFADL